MAGAERRNTRRPTQAGFVDSTQIDLSSDDEVVNTRAGRKGTRTLREFIADSDSDQEKDNTRGLRTRQSDRLAQSQYKQTASDEEEEDEAEAEGSSDDYDVLARPSKRLKRAPRLHLRGPQRLRNESPQGRRSERTRQAPRRDMRERGEDEISETEIHKPALKVVGAKEVFLAKDKVDDFRLRHHNTCSTCFDEGDSKVKGPLVFCQGCTVSFHKQCLGPRGTREHLVTKIDDELFVLQCRFCLGMNQKKDEYAPHHGTCSECKEGGLNSQPFRDRKTTKQEQKEREDNDGEDPAYDIDPDRIDNPNNVLFRCVTCRRAWHMAHLPKRHDEDYMDTAEDENAAEARFEEYCGDWVCKECATAPDSIDALVAWRPVDEESYIHGCSVEVVNEDDKEYLVKWKDMSYHHTDWRPGAWVWGVTAAAMRRAFARKNNGSNMPTMTREDAIPEEYLRVDIVLDVRYTSVVSQRSKVIDLQRVKEVEKAYVKMVGLGYEDAVWVQPPSPDEKDQWADFKLAYEDWVMGHYIHIPKSSSLKKHLDTVRSQDRSLMKQNAQPKSLTGGEIMDYQLGGLNWLLGQWHQKQNAVLADEMGLGKTIQVIAFFASLVQDHKCWPFLVVVPNSTAPNWRREVKKWAPSLRVVAYYGSSVAKKLANDYELFHKGSNNQKELACHIVVTSYDAITEDGSRRFFQKVPWQGLVVDEGQRLKNDKNQLYEGLGKINFPFKLLLTGTPLQNNARELFNLLQFLDPSFDATSLELEYAELTKDNLPRLHELLRPFFLRRTKAQVLNFLPGMAQIIVPVTMSVLQKKLYKSILVKKPQLIKSIFRTGEAELKPTERGNLNNILMQLRKTLCHPFVYSRQIEERSTNEHISYRNLVDASSKLRLLEIMLPKLYERGHRVLIFSQFLDNLSMVEDFLDGLGLLYHRLDGSLSSLQKQRKIDDFNAPGSPLFAFLLSTRAGGVGINLATADTVIIMDPDFNPHQDIQALSRAHRIGQKKKVLCFQLMTRGSAEEKIMQIGKKKMALDHVLIEQMDADDDAGVDLESILRHGASALFENDTSNDIIYDSASVDKLLDRSQVENTQTGMDDSAESQFSFARVWANDSGNLEDALVDTDDSSRPDPTVWDNILKERERAAAEEAANKAETFGRGKRQRRHVDYGKQDAEISPKKPQDLRDSDTDFQTRGDSEVSDVEDSGPGDLASDVEELRQSQKKALGKSSTIVPSQADDAATNIRHPQFAPSQPPQIRFPRTLPVQVAPWPRTKAPRAPKMKRAVQLGITQQGPNPPPSTNGTYSHHFPQSNANVNDLECLACGKRHQQGQCPIKLAGAEQCPLCGLHHFGKGRSCPALQEISAIDKMLRDLKNSPESKEVIENATKYLRGVKGDLARRQRVQKEKEYARAVARAERERREEQDRRAYELAQIHDGNHQAHSPMYIWNAHYRSRSLSPARGSSSAGGTFDRFRVNPPDSGMMNVSQYAYNNVLLPRNPDQLNGSPAVQRFRPPPDGQGSSKDKPMELDD